MLVQQLYSKAQLKIRPWRQTLLQLALTQSDMEQAKCDSVRHYITLSHLNFRTGGWVTHMTSEEINICILLYAQHMCEALHSCEV